MCHRLLVAAESLNSREPFDLLVAVSAQQRQAPPLWFAHPIAAAALCQSGCSFCPTAQAAGIPAALPIPFSTHLQDHRQSLALFTQFFKAAAAAEAAESPTSPRAASAKAASDARREAAALKLAAGALAIDLRLHAQASATLGIILP